MHSRNGGGKTRLIQASFGGEWGGRGFDERQEDARCIRGVNQPTCRWASPWWYGMAPSSSGAILSMSARFSRLDAQQQQHTTQHTAVRPGKREKKAPCFQSPVCRVRFSTYPFLVLFVFIIIFFFTGWKMACRNFKIRDRVKPTQKHKLDWVPASQLEKANIPIVKTNKKKSLFFFMFVS